MKQLKYIDTRPIKMNLKHGGWIALPNSKTGNILNVTDAEASALLKRTNGTLPCFELVRPEREPRARRQSEE
jgi:hypothetical protein